MGQDISIMIMH